MTQENVYEGLFILDSERYARNPDEVSKQISQIIESFGGKMRVSRLWEERRLAYPIKNQKRGTYWLTYFRINTDKMSELNRQFQLDNNILRFLLTRVEPSLEEALVQHALAGPAKREEAPPRETTQRVTKEIEPENVDVVDSIEEE